jgi:hypothetical protein
MHYCAVFHTFPIKSNKIALQTIKMILGVSVYFLINQSGYFTLVFQSIKSTVVGTTVATGVNFTEQG